MSKLSQNEDIYSMRGLVSYMQKEKIRQFKHKQSKKQIETTFGATDKLTNIKKAP